MNDLASELFIPAAQEAAAKDPGIFVGQAMKLAIEGQTDALRMLFVADVLPRRHPGVNAALKFASANRLANEAFSGGDPSAHRGKLERSHDLNLQAEADAALAGWPDTFELGFDPFPVSWLK